MWEASALGWDLLLVQAGTAIEKTEGGRTSGLVHQCVVRIARSYMNVSQFFWFFTT